MQNNIAVLVGSVQQLPVGPNTITYTATDANGNVASVSTVVTVESGENQTVRGESCINICETVDYADLRVNRMPGDFKISIFLIIVLGALANALW
jgi:hypothetical protein